MFFCVKIIIGDSMRENLKQYNAYLDEIINGSEIKNKEDLLDEILTQIKFFQHERLVHLIVTFFEGIGTVLFLGFGLITGNLGMYLLFLVGIMLFFPYILHYYYLENGTQALYKKYFTIKEK